MSLGWALYNVKGFELDPEGSGEPAKVFMDMVSDMSLIQTTRVAVQRRARQEGAVRAAQCREASPRSEGVA